MKLSRSNVGRHATSCTECHRRKVKCDQASPCLRCVKRGTAHLCTVGYATSNSSTRKLASHQFARLPMKVEDVIWQDVVSTLLNPTHQQTLSMLLHIFKTRWNWTYEIIDDTSIDQLASHRAFPALFLAVITNAVLVSDAEIICATFSHLFEQFDCGIIQQHSQIVLIFEEAFIQSFHSSSNLNKENDGIAQCQAIFIYGVYCKTQSKDASKIFNNGKDWYTNMSETLKRYDIKVDKGEERNSLIRSRIFWNVAAQDINYSLYSFSKPAISYADIQSSNLPQYCKVDDNESNRQWRYVLVWFRARICRDVLEVAHQKVNSDGSDLIQEAIRRLQVTELLLPEPFRVTKVSSHNILLKEIKDPYLVRTRGLISMLYHKAIEAVTRLAMIGLLPTSDRQLIRHACATSAQQTIQWLLQGRVLAKNRGDLHCIWQLAPASSCFTSLVYAIVDHITTLDPLFLASNGTKDALEWSWLNSLQESLDFLDIICDSKRSKKLLQSYQSMYQKVQRLVCLDRPALILCGDNPILLSPKEAADRISLLGCHKLLDRLLSTSSSDGLSIDADSLIEMEQWFALFLDQST